MKFNYIARTNTAEVETGQISAPSQAEAVELLHGRNLVVLSCQPTLSLPFWLKDIKIKSIKQKDLVIFSRQLAALFSARVPLVTALRALARQQENSYFKEIIFGISNDVEAGFIFSKALSKHPNEFSTFYINLVKSGEVSGNLEAVLNYLADHLEKQYYLMTRVRNAMIYPAFICLGFIAVAVLMLIFVIPNLTSVLEEAGQELPLTTRMIIGLSRLIINWGWLILLFLVGVGVFIWRYFQTPEGRAMFDAIKLKMPIFGNIFKKLYVARFTENFSTLLKGGVPVLQALQVAGEVVGNVVFSQIIFEAREGVRVGNTISSVLENSAEIPPMVSQMVATGEKIGQLEFVLEKTASFYKREVDDIVDTISVLIEPVLIVVLGIGVAILLTAILMPIYNLAGVM
ncbi:type II secretion system F family protein [Candidatus Falkowbacteria bacterium]|nr:type II secretion system F family protein [Candidatus Falkowbacteria bacterium]